MFSVLGGREIAGRTGTILEGESGANDPVGIALMIGMIEFATSDDGSFWTVVRGVRGRDGASASPSGSPARRLAPPARCCGVPLPEPALYPLRVLAAGGRDLRRAPRSSTARASSPSSSRASCSATRRCRTKREIEGFLSSLASLAEITVFVALGLTVDLTERRSTSGVWLDGLVSPPCSAS